MKLKAVVAAVAMVAAAGGANAACSALSFSGTPELATFNNFASPLTSADTTDCYTFSLGAGGSISTGLVSLLFGSGTLAFTLSGGSLPGTVALPTDGSVFSTALGAGLYTLSMQYAGLGAGYYSGSITAVPEPGTIALMLAGLGVVGFLAKRRGVIGGQPMPA